MNGTYGVVRPSVIDPLKDVDIFYHYRPSRSSQDTTFKNFKKIENVASILSKSNVEVESLGDDNVLQGMFNLSLPVSIFGKKGIYTIYIKPKEYMFEIKDVGSLAAYPDQRGIIIDINNSESDNGFFGADNLVGYRIEYFSTDSNSNKLVRQDYYRIITSNNNCEPVSQNLTSSNTNSNGYRFNDSGGLSFITVTPSTGPDFNGNSKPYIGTPNQMISIVNTKFDPVMIELEMVEHDIETLSIMAEGDQIRNLENGRVTTYNFDGEIYKQVEHFTLKDNYTQNNVAEIKIDKSDNIDNRFDINELKKENE